MPLNLKSAFSIAAVIGSVAMVSTAQAATKTYSFSGVWDSVECSELCTNLGSFSGQFTYDDATPVVIDTGSTYDTGHIDRLITSEGDVYEFVGGDEFILSGEGPGFGWQITTSIGEFWAGSFSLNGLAVADVNAFASIYLPTDPDTDVNPDFTLPLSPGDTIVTLEASPFSTGLALLASDSSSLFKVTGHLTSLTDVTKAAPSDVPLPGALPLLAAGLAGLAGLSRRRNTRK